jgi:hypothetical protein
MIYKINIGMYSKPLYIEADDDRTAIERAAVHLINDGGRREIITLDEFVNDPFYKPGHDEKPFNDYQDALEYYNRLYMDLSIYDDLKNRQRQWLYVLDLTYTSIKPLDTLQKQLEAYKEYCFNDYLADNDYINFKQFIKGVKK